MAALEDDLLSDAHHHPPLLPLHIAATYRHIDLDMFTPLFILASAVIVHAASIETVSWVQRLGGASSSGTKSDGRPNSTPPPASSHSSLSASAAAAQISPLAVALSLSDSTTPSTPTSASTFGAPRDLESRPWSSRASSSVPSYLLHSVDAFPEIRSICDLCRITEASSPAQRPNPPTTPALSNRTSPAAPASTPPSRPFLLRL